MPTLVFYDDRDDNRILQLQENATNLDTAGYDALTNVELHCRAQDGTITTLESDTPAHKVTIDSANQQLVLELGLATDLPVGVYWVRVIGYTAADPAGLVYADFGELQILKKA